MAGNFTLCAAKIGSLVIGKLTELSVSEEIQAMLAATGGDVYTRQASVGQIKPRGAFASQDLKGVLTAVSLCGGVAVTSEEKVVLYYQQYEDGAGRTAAGCITFTCEKGLVIVRRVDGQQGAAATVSAEIFPVSADGQTSPWVKATGVAIPTVTHNPPYTVAGSTGVQSISIDTGIEVMEDSGDDDVYPTRLAIESQTPTIEIEQRDDADLGATATNSVSFVDAAPGGTRGTSQITFTVNEGLKWTPSTSGSAGPKSSKLQITAVFDGTNAPVVVAGLS